MYTLLSDPPSSEMPWLHLYLYKADKGNPLGHHMGKGGSDLENRHQEWTNKQSYLSTEATPKALPFEKKQGLQDP